MSDSTETFPGQHTLAYVASLWRVATFRSSVDAAQHYLIGGCLCVLRNLNFTTLLTYLFPQQKIHVRVHTFYRTGPSRF